MKEIYPREGYGRISLSKSNYLKEEDFWKDVADIQRVLTNNHRTTILQYDDVGVYNLYYAWEKEKETGVYSAIVEDDDEDYTEGHADEDCETSNPINGDIDCTTKSDFFHSVEFHKK